MNRLVAGVLVAPTLVAGVLAGCAARATPLLDGEPRRPNRPAVVIDGEFADWRGRPTLARGGSAGSAPGLALGAIRAAHDAGAVYFLIDLSRVVNLQLIGSATLHLPLDVDGDESTGQAVEGVPGTDMVVTFSPVRNDAGGNGVLIRIPGDSTWHDSGLAGLYYGPTHGSATFEIRLARRPVVRPGLPPAFVGARFRGRFVLRDRGGAVLDRTAVFSHQLAAGEGDTHAADAAAVARAAGADLRVLTWNMGDRGPLRAEDPYWRTLTAIDPDLMLLDELHPSIDQAWLERFAGRIAPGPWRVIVGGGGGRQRTAVVSRLPVEPVPALARVEYPDSIRAIFGLPLSRQMTNDLATAFVDGIPAVGAAVRVGEARVLVMSMDFFCCGGIGGPDDRARVMVADAIRSAARRTLDAGGIDAVILGGDLNLVGSRTPLDVLRQGLDPAGGDLVSVPGYRLNGVSNTTWRAPGTFPPGKLDYLLVSGSRFQVLRSFAFDPGDLTVAGRRALGLEDGDDVVTDHLPVVADLRLR